MTDEDPLTLPGADRPGFRRGRVRIEPGELRPYRPSEWVDCLVVIECGEVEIEATSGVRHTCHAGDVLWLADLSLRCLTNRGLEPAVLTTVRRG